MNWIKTTITTLLIAAMAGFLATEDSKAQTAYIQFNEHEFFVGAGMGHSFGLELTGLDISTYYAFSPRFRAGANFQLFPIDETDESANEVNVNGHYVFMMPGIMRLYGLGGINYYSETDRLGTESEFGYNVGAGFEVSLPLGDFYIEPKYIISGTDQLNVTAGGRLSF